MANGLVFLRLARFRGEEFLKDEIDKAMHDGCPDKEAYRCNVGYNTTLRDDNVAQELLQPDQNNESAS